MTGQRYNYYFKLASKRCKKIAERTRTQTLLYSHTADDDTADDDTADSHPIYYFISIFLAHSEFLLIFALRK